jgi:DNA-binding ferritin-like protein
MNILLQLLAILRALQWSHQTAHWKVRGEPFYGDHLLFQKLYEAVGEEIDTLAEKIVGIYGPGAITNLSLLSDTHKFVANHAASGVGDNPYQCALLMEEHLQRALKLAYDELKASGEMSLGLDDFLMATANAHETALYLLRQRNRPKAASAKTAALPPAKTWLETQLGKVFTDEAAGHEFWFIPSSVTKSNTAKGHIVTIVWVDSTKPSKAKQTTLPERDLLRWKVLSPVDVPDPVKARFQEVGVRVASTDHFAALRQPKGYKPVYEGNAMAVPLTWGTAGKMVPYDVAQYMAPLFDAAKGGVAYVLDQNKVFTAAGLAAVEKALEQRIADDYGEQYAMDSEYFQGNDTPNAEIALTISGEQADMARKVKVKITPITSPTSGKAGLKVVFNPTHDQIKAIR